MFKRILVLVLFLLLVFWWLSSRNDDKVETPDTTAEVQTEENTEAEGTETEASTDGETESTEANEEGEENTEAEADSAEVKTEEEAPKTTETKSTEAPAATTPKTTYRPPSRPVVSVPDVQTNVKVYMYEWNVDMSKKTIPSGTVNFQVQNDGRFTHDFSINGYGNLGKVNPGQSQTFTLKLKPGTYEAFSDRRQDYERGVKESFTVN